MPKEERQRKLYNQVLRPEGEPEYLHQTPQYYFTCACQPCTSNWPVYSSLPQSAVPIAGTAPEQVNHRTNHHNKFPTKKYHQHHHKSPILSHQAKQIVSEHHKAAKQYKKAFDFVLTSKLRYGLEFCDTHHLTTGNWHLTIGT